MSVLVAVAQVQRRPDAATLGRSLIVFERLGVILLAEHAVVIVRAEQGHGSGDAQRQIRQVVAGIRCSADYLFQGGTYETRRTPADYASGVLHDAMRGGYEQVLYDRPHGHPTLLVDLPFDVLQRFNGHRPHLVMAQRLFEGHVLIVIEIVHGVPFPSLVPLQVAAS